jgi:hypothetical protein
MLDKYSGRGLRVMVVSGQAVRDRCSVDFSLAGHDKVYDFIPSNEVWVEEGLSPHDKKVILVHELWERHLMAGGMAYEEAHERANRIEKSVRDSPEMVDEILAYARKVNIL